MTLRWHRTHVRSHDLPQKLWNGCALMVHVAVQGDVCCLSGPVCDEIAGRNVSCQSSSSVDADVPPDFPGANCQSCGLTVRTDPCVHSTAYLPYGGAACSNFPELADRPHLILDLLRKHQTSWWFTLPRWQERVGKLELGLECRATSAAPLVPVASTALRARTANAKPITLRAAGSKHQECSDQVCAGNASCLLLPCPLCLLLVRSLAYCACPSSLGDADTNL